jgi:hypothetical protein
MPNEMWKEKQEEKGQAERGWKRVARGLHNITDVICHGLQQQNSNLIPFHDTLMEELLKIRSDSCLRTIKSRN